MAITDANAWLERDEVTVRLPGFMKEIVEEIARLARASAAINQQSGVSVRMSIANAENMVSNAERRGLLLGEPVAVPRVSDLQNLTASSRGKIELTMSEDDGQEDRVLEKLLGEAVKNVFESYFEVKTFRPLVEWFEAGHTIVVGDRVPSAEYSKRASAAPVLRKEAAGFLPKALPHHAASEEEMLLASAIEFILEGLHVSNRLNKTRKPGQVAYKR
jgi:magnesium chelatase subunit I